MAARRTAGDRNEIRVAAVLGDVLLDPGQRPLDVDDVVRPGVSRADAVVDRHAYPAAVGHVAQQRIGLRPPHADRPRAAGHLQQHGRLSVTGQVGAAPDVGEVDPAVRAVLNGAGLLDVATADQFVGKHADPGAATPAPAATAMRSPRSRHRALRAAAPRNAAATRTLRRWISHNRRPCDRGEQQRDSAARAAEVATQPAAHRVEHRAGHVQRRHLRRGPAEREDRNGDVPLAGDGPHTVGGVDQFRDRAQQRIPTLTHGGP